MKIQKLSIMAAVSLVLFSGAISNSYAALSGQELDNAKQAVQDAACKAAEKYGTDTEEKLRQVVGDTFAAAKNAKLGDSEASPIVQDAVNNVDTRCGRKVAALFSAGGWTAGQVTAAVAAAVTLGVIISNADKQEDISNSSQ